MYCRNCGQELKEGDKFCSACGAKTVSEDMNHITDNLDIHVGGDFSRTGDSPLSSETTASYEPFDFSTINFGFDLDLNANAAQAEAEEEIKKTITPVEDFDWNIHTFPGMEARKTEDVDFNWSMPLDEPEPEKEPEPVEIPETATQKEPHGEAVSKEEEPEVFTPEESRWNTVEKEESHIKEDMEPPSETGLEEELFGSLDSKTDEARKQSEEIDKFFTFHKKNEEFQKLLDQEYEKIKSGNILADEMDTAEAASEQKFASRKPEDPMEDLFVSEGIVKGYEPKPVETDVLDRIEAAEADKKAREESARLIEEAKARAAEEAKAAEEAARKRLEDEAKRAADARAAQEAAERERARAAAREETMAAMKAVEDKAEQKRQEIEAKITEQAAKMEAEAEKIREAAEARERAEQERLAREAAEAKAAEEARLKAEEEARARAEAEEKAAEEAARIRQEEEARKEAEAKAAREAEEQAHARAAQEAEKADADNHIAEMVRARQTFFDQKMPEPDQEEESEALPIKTKAVDKAAILAGMATASEMVQRDRAYAAAEAAKADQAETPQKEESAGSTPSSFDLLSELQSVAEQAKAAAEETEASDNLFSIDDLLDDESLDTIEETPIQDTIEEEQTEETGQEQEELFETAELQLEEDPEVQLFDEALPEEDPQDPVAVVGENAVVAEAPQSEDLFGDEFEDEEEEYTGGKGRTVLKICLVILIILLAIEIAGVVIKMAMPSSSAAKFIDRKLNQVIQMVTGDDTEYRVIAATEKVRENPVEDKTGLIQAEMGKNKDGNIGSIEYNADLKFDPDKQYENADIALTQNLADVTWYKDAANKQVYYDQAIVGTVIAYGSQRVNMSNYNDSSVLNLMQQGTDLYKEVKNLGEKGVRETFKTLQIGEIRQAGSQYYVWVSEKVKNSESGMSTTARIYEMTPEGETMKMVASYMA